MNTHVVLPFRAKRCDTFALELNRARVKADLQAYQAEKDKALKEPLALRAALVAVRLILGAAWLIVFVIAALVCGVAFATAIAIGEKWDGRYPRATK
jgi:t-SNARE complex subunit (syntaxin)